MTATGPLSARVASVLAEVENQVQAEVEQLRLRLQDEALTALLSKADLPAGLPKVYWLPSQRGDIDLHAGTATYKPAEAVRDVAVWAARAGNGTVDVNDIDGFIIIYTHIRIDDLTAEISTAITPRRVKQTGLDEAAVRELIDSVLAEHRDAAAVAS